MNSLSLRLILTLFIGIIGCVTKFDPLDSCTSDQDCFRGEVCLESAGSDARCVTGEPMPTAERMDMAGTDMVAPDEGVLVDAAVSQDASMEADATMENTMENTEPFLQWDFTDPTMPLVARGRLAGMAEFELHGGADIHPTYGLDLTAPASPNASNVAILKSGNDLLHAAIVESDAFTIKVWVQTVEEEQRGPARILTWSESTSKRNLTIGHGLADDIRLGYDLLARVRIQGGGTEYTNDNGSRDRVPTTDNETQDAVAPVALRYTEQVNPSGEPLGPQFKADGKFDYIAVSYGAHDTGGSELFMSHEGNTDSRIFNENGTTVSLDSFDPDYVLALGDELSNSAPRPDGNLESRQWRGYIHSIQIYDRRISDVESLGPDTASIDFICPTADSTTWMVDESWMVAPCNEPYVTDVDGRYCEYFVDSGSGEDFTGLNCEDFCQAIGMRTCTLGEECCWNNPPDRDQCMHGFPLDCIREQGYQSQICRCFEVATEMSESVEMQPDRSR